MFDTALALAELHANGHVCIRCLTGVGTSGNFVVADVDENGDISCRG